MNTTVNLKCGAAAIIATCMAMVLGTADASSPRVDDPSFIAFAAAQGITPEVALERLELRRMAGEIDERAQREAPNTYGGMEVVHLPKYHIVFRFTGNASGQLSRYTANPNFVAATVPRPIALVQSVRKQVMQNLAGHGVEAIASIDFANSVIIVEAENAAEARFHLRDLLNTYKFIEIKERSSFPTPLDIQGGMEGTGERGGNYYRNTLGFTVVDGNGLVGVAQAGHSPDVFVALDGQPLTLKFESENDTGSYDVQWFTQYPGGTLKKQSNVIMTRNPASPEMEITGTRGLSTLRRGDPVCKSGATTQYTCGTILDPNFAHTRRDDQRFGEWILIEPLVARRTFVRGGDSGGPVFDAGNAIGIISAGWEKSRVDPFYGRALAMSVDKFATLGLEVVTEKFEIQSIPSVTGNHNVTIPALINFVGHPLFPVQQETVNLTCPGAWICPTLTKTHTAPSNSPLEFSFRCNTPTPLPEATFTWQTKLTGADGVVYQSQTHSSTCKPATGATVVDSSARGGARGSVTMGR